MHLESTKGLEQSIGTLRAPKPIVAIVGRPNVGKSTLFNRLAREKKAIVLDFPGVTYDRNYADVALGERLVVLVDTGGLEPSTGDEMFQLVRGQVQLAMDEADLIVFCVDAQEGLMPTDLEIADLLRRTAKPVVLAVNKIDGPRHEALALEFARLGIEPAICVSAAHGTGAADLADAVCELLPEEPEEGETDEEEDAPLRVAVVGRPNVGKSSLVNRLLGYDRVIVHHEPGTTRDAIDTPFTYQGARYVLVDTAGIRRKGRVKRLTEKYSVIQGLKHMDRADVAVLLVDAAEGMTDQDAHIAGYAEERGCGLVLVLNKWDLVPKDHRTADEMVRELKREYGFLGHVPVLTASALSGQRVQRVLELVARVGAEYRRRVPTGALNELLRSAAAARPPGLAGKRRIKFYYITQTGVGAPEFVIFTNRPDEVHFSYRRYLVNQLRASFGFEGVPLRLVFRGREKKRARR